MKYYDLNDGNRIPALGLGTYKITDEAILNEVIETAFDAGYTYFDTAKFYNNEEMLGRALKNAPQKRSDYQLVTKVRPNAFATDETEKSLDSSLKSLDTDYLDLALLHRPGHDFEKARKVLIDYKKQGIVKSIGVCNFEISQIEELLKSGEAPVIDQMESHPYFQNPKLFTYLKDKKIIHQARGPLTQGKSGLLKEEVLKKIGQRYGKSPAQIVLKRNIQRGGALVVKSKTASRIKENIDIFDFDISKEDMQKLKGLDKNKRFSHDPEDKAWLDEISK